MNGVRDDIGKKYEHVSNIKDYQKEVHDNTHDADKDVILAVVAGLNNIMITMTTTLWKEVTDARDDEVVNSEIMELLGRDDIKTANAQLSATTEAGHDKDKLNNAIEKRVNEKFACKEAQTKRITYTIFGRQ